MSKYAEARLIKVDEMEAITDIPKHRQCCGYILVPQDTGVSFSFSLAEIFPGGEAEPDVHEGREHCFFVLSGLGKAKVNGKEFIVKHSECLWIPPGAEHEIRPVGGQTLRFLVVTFPASWKNVK
jgi:mannose-6-phosphate isomerase-like protein (cupin superfamily)